MTKKTEGTGARMTAEDRRRQIVVVAMRLFSQRGFRGTTTKEIAQAAGVSEAIIFRHFATKQELYAAILDHKACAGQTFDPCEHMSEALARQDDAAFFEELALAVLRHHEEDEEFLRLLQYSALEGHELAQMFWDRNVRQVYEKLGGYVRQRQREGALRDLDPIIVVRAFVGMIIHHSINNSQWDKPRALLNITNEEAARAFTDILLRGISEPPVSSGRAPKKGARRPPRPKNKKQS